MLRSLIPLLLTSSAACTASSDDVRPPSDQLFFPTGLAVGGGSLFVANSNSELRFDSGSLNVIDLAVVDSVINGWLTSGDRGPCAADPDHRETLVCDEAMFIRSGAGVRIGNFATELTIQDFTRPGGPPKLRVLAATRGDPSIAWADYQGDQLECGGGSTFGVCDEAHRLAQMLGDPDLPIFSEPFGIYAATQPSASDPTNPNAPLRGFAVVSHLANGAVTLIDSPEDGPAQLVDVLVGLFNSNSSTSLPGATGVSGRSPGSNDNIIYVGSRTDDRVQTFTIGRPINNGLPFLIPGSYFLLDGAGDIAGTGEAVDGRGIQFSPTGDRLYMVNRFPPVAQIYDTSIGPTGTPRNTITGASDICRQASTVTVLDLGALGERAYITCFQDGEIYVVDPSGSSTVEDIITVGRGPYSVVAAKDQQRLFVTNYLEDTIAVIDVNPISPTRNRVVLRIGEPKIEAAQ